MQQGAGGGGVVLARCPEDGKVCCFTAALLLLYCSFTAAVLLLYYCVVLARCAAEGKVLCFRA